MTDTGENRTAQAGDFFDQLAQGQPREQDSFMAEVRELIRPEGVAIAPEADDDVDDAEEIDAEEVEELEDEG